MLLTPERIEAALASIGENGESAAVMKHGAILWRGEYHKMRVSRVTPIGRQLREEIDRYLNVWDAEARANEKRTTRHMANAMLRRAEALAGLPKVRGAGWHAFRRGWATSRKDLPDVDVAEAGGWKGTKAMKLSYQQPTTTGILRAIDIE